MNETDIQRYDYLLTLLREYNWKPQKSCRNANMRMNQYSANVGYTRTWFKKGLPIVKSSLMKKNKDVIYNECARLFPERVFDGLMINKNFKCPPHKDKNNKGDSLIIGLGDYTGGDLYIDGVPHDIRYKPTIFNGAEMEHYVDDFEGERYSVVLFKL